MERQQIKKEAGQANGTSAEILPHPNGESEIPHSRRATIGARTAGGVDRVASLEVPVDNISKGEGVNLLEARSPSILSSVEVQIMEFDTEYDTDFTTHTEYVVYVTTPYEDRWEGRFVIDHLVTHHEVRQAMLFNVTDEINAHKKRGLSGDIVAIGCQYQRLAEVLDNGPLDFMTFGRKACLKVFSPVNGEYLGDVSFMVRSVFLEETDSFPTG